MDELVKTYAHLLLAPPTRRSSRRPSGSGARSQTCTSDKLSKPALGSVVSSVRSADRAGRGDDQIVVAARPARRPEYRPGVPTAEIVLCSA